MGVEVVRIDTTFTVAGSKLEGRFQRKAGQVQGSSTFGYLLSNRENASAIAVNRLLAAGETVKIATDSAESIYPGYFIIQKRAGTDQAIEKLSTELGITFHGLTSEPSVSSKTLTPIKIGIYKSWQANMDEGWTRWMLEQHGFDLDTLHNEEIQAGDLSMYDAIIFPSQNPDGILNGYREGARPPKFVGGVGARGAVALQEYVKSGGVLLAFDAASDFFINQYGLAVRNVTQRLSSNQFFIPGSLVRMNVRTDHFLGYGMQDEVAASFARSRSFERVLKSRKGEGGNEDTPMPTDPKVEIVSHYADKDILMSGWAMGEDKYLKNKASLLDVSYGEGHIILFGFRPQFRGQPRGTYKLIFNAIYMGASED